MTAFLGEFLTGAALTGLGILAVMFVVRVVVHVHRYRRRHRRRANRLFLAGYRAGHRHASASTAERRRHSG